jgi:glycosyltransferase involved in cell wall biosynthesis
LSINKSHVVFVLPNFSGGGAERVAINILTGIHNSGHLVDIIVFDKSGPLIALVPEDIQIHALRTLRLRKSIIALIKKIRQLKPKVIFSTLGYINIALLFIRWLLPKKTKIFIREANLPSISLPNNPHTKLMNILYMYLYRKSDKLICSSKIMKSEFSSDFLIPESIMEVLPNPVDIDMIRNSCPSIKRFDRGGVCYISAGRLNYQKGFDRLLYWLSSVNNKTSTLVILGDGGLKCDLLRKVELLNLQKQVKFIGFCDNPWQWYAGADAFLLSSRWEGMPNSALESLACGTKVIATDESGGIKEIDNNSVIIAKDSVEFINAMKEVNIKNKKNKCSSLLPMKYEKKNVSSIVERWLNEV